VYEYSMEGSKYGLVTISGNSVEELGDFTTLQKQLAANPVPSGDGGYKAAGAVSACPPTNAPSWVVANSSLPQMPVAARKYFDSGAGPAPGLSNIAGSQTSGTGTPGFTGTGTGTGNGTGTSSGTKTGSASSLGVGAWSWSVAGAAVVAVVMSTML
jgi:hypothetical protein